MSRDNIYGIVAAFGDPTRLLHAARESHRAGFRALEAYSPFPIDGLDDAIGVKATRIPYIVLAGALFGALGGYALQYYSAVIDYPLNVGGRPLNSWPAFLMVTFAMGILGGSLAAFFGMLVLNRLPHYYHPIFNADDFSLAYEDAFFLCIEARDPRFDVDKVTHYLQQFGPEDIQEVYNE